MNVPFYTIEIKGVPATDEIAPSLRELRLCDRSGVHADSLELELADEPFKPWPRPGVDMKVTIGYTDSDVERVAKHFAIDQVEHSGPPAMFQVSAASADFTGQARAPRERSFHGTSDKPLTIEGLITQLATEHGYTAKVEPAELANTRLDDVDQAGLSDLALAHQVASEHDAVFKPVDGIWWVRGYSALGEPAATIRPGDVSTWRAHFMARVQYASVKAHYHDFDTARRVPVVVGEGVPQLTLDQTFHDEQAARANAEAAFSRAERAARRLSLTMPGRPDLASQMVIRLEGFRDRVDDRWLITQVTHTINKRGYTCRVEAEGA
jgi:phage protein D